MANKLIREKEANPLLLRKTAKERLPESSKPSQKVGHPRVTFPRCAYLSVSAAGASQGTVPRCSGPSGTPRAFYSISVFRGIYNRGTNSRPLPGLAISHEFTANLTPAR